MISGIRNIELAMGNCIKTPAPGEIKKRAARISIVAVKPIKKGEIIALENLTEKRREKGLALYCRIRHREKTTRNFEQDSEIEL